MNFLFDTSNAPGSLGNKFRQKRLKSFKEIVKKMEKPITILDIGGSEIFWKNLNFHNDNNIHIKVLNITDTKTNYSNIEFICGDALDLNMYKDNIFDIVFSNSMIEHLYSKEKQMKVTKDIIRIGRYHYIQTPNKFFFMEPHYLLPYFQFFPRKIKYIILTRTKLSRFKYWEKSMAKQYLEEIRLISEHEMKIFFPDSILLKENFFGLTKSFTAHNFPISFFK
jgi:ubiquinone/menaquinone biosynthesis C-methylase UbiE